MIEVRTTRKEMERYEIKINNNPHEPLFQCTVHTNVVPEFDMHFAEFVGWNETVCTQMGTLHCASTCCSYVLNTTSSSLPRVRNCKDTRRKREK
jgi:hypothetical protein